MKNLIILGLLTVLLIYLFKLNTKEPFKINLTRPIKKKTLKKVSLKGKKLTPVIKKISSIIPNNYKEKIHKKYQGYKHPNLNNKLSSLLQNKLKIHSNNSYEEYSTEEPPELIVNENDN